MKNVQIDKLCCQEEEKMERVGVRSELVLKSSINNFLKGV